MRSELVGTWRLLDFQVERDGILEPWCSEYSGMLLYQDNGTMAAVINGWRGPGNSEPIVLAYSASWYLSDNRVYHQVQQATDPQRIGKTLCRSPRCFDDKLELSVVGGNLARLLWQRVVSQPGSD